MVVLQAATTLYHQRLLSDPTAMAYLTGRGIDHATIDACQLGYAAGDELISICPGDGSGPSQRCASACWAATVTSSWLAVSSSPTSAASSRCGSLAGFSNQPSSPTRRTRRRSDLGLPGSKPLMGLQQVAASPSVIATEGVFDWLTLRRWGYPAVALLGTHARPDILELLRGFQRVYLVLDQDDAGLEAIMRLMDALGPVAIPVALPDDIKDVAELGPRADGQAVFASALLEAVGATKPCALVSTTGAPDELA
ncbi:MAG: hypothetical protein DMG80_14200 [Acidobacteria bacterium]|nr:MAG: hypothetical protein DMG80_14200 [Acidobacteriota bacterium]